jgi:hypothetical protein
MDGGAAGTCPLTCGRDLTCRDQCQADIDCPGQGTAQPQKCTTSHVCVDPKVDMSIYDPTTNDFKANVSGAGGSTGVGGTTGTGGALAGASGTGGPDAAAGTTGTAGSAAGTSGTAGASGGSGGTTGTAGSNADGGAGTGAGGTMTDGGGMNPEVAVTPDGTMVTPSAKLRQGQQSTLSLTVTVTKAAGGLGNPMVVGDTGGLTVKVDSSSTATSLVLKVAAPHATPLGKKTLTVSTASGVVTLTEIVEVTAITAAPTGSDTTTNTGASDSPFRSLKNAIAVADVGDTIHLVDGTYSALPTASGGSAETWGYMLPTDITVIGDSTAGTILDGVGINNVDGFDVLKSLTLQNLTLQDFRYGVDVSKDTSTLKMTDVVLTNNTSYGLYIETGGSNSMVTMMGTKSAISSSTQSAFYSNGAQNLTVNITDAAFQSGGDVIQWSGNMSGSNLSITNGSIKQLMTYNAINFVYISNNTAPTSLTLTNVAVTGTITDGDAKGAITIMGGTVTEKSGDCINMAANTLTMNGTMVTTTTANASNNGINITSGIGSMISLKSVTISGGGRGISQSGAGSQLKLRSTTIQNTLYDGIYLTNGNLDMGTAAESGDNFIATPTSSPDYYYYCINVYRSSGTATPVTASGTSVGAAGAVPAPTTIDATAGSVSTLPKWNVYTGNKLVFY